jgi:glutamate/tyrosine decarboxylase-like PLP-dependent enzyme
VATERNFAERIPASDLLLDAAERTRIYLQTIGERKVPPQQSDLAALVKLHEPFPAHGSTPQHTLATLDAIGSPATMATAGRRYFGFVIGGSFPVSMAANWLAAAWDQNAALRVMSPIAAELEEVVLSWVCEAFGLPPECEGGLVTCATTANFTALAAARYSLLAKAGWDVTEEGMFGAPPIEVVVGEEGHASVSKALSLAGFGRKRVHIVEADGQGRMRADKLPKLTSRTIVCIQAGNVNTGSFDPAVEICAKAQDAGAWVHVDGAFGMWARLSPEYAHLLAGFENAHSWATDAHKWPNVTYESGIVIVREGAALRAAMTMSAAYLEPGARREPMHHTPEASRRARGVELWAVLKTLGRSGLRDLIERTCRYAQRFASGLARAGYPILNEVVINQVLVSFGSAEITREVIRCIQEDGTCWCSGTVWKGHTAMRISVSSWATTEADVERSLEAILKIANRVTLPL